MKIVKLGDFPVEVSGEDKIRTRSTRVYLQVTLPVEGVNRITSGSLRFTTSDPEVQQALAEGRGQFTLSLHYDLEGPQTFESTVQKAARRAQEGREIDLSNVPGSADADALAEVLGTSPAAGEDWGDVLLRAMKADLGV